MGALFRFLGLCVCLGVQRGLRRVLIKYSGNVRLQSIITISSMEKLSHANYSSLLAIIGKMSKLCYYELTVSSDITKNEVNATIV